MPWGAGEPVTPVTFAESLIVPDLPSTVVPWRVEAFVVIGGVAAPTLTHSVVTADVVAAVFSWALV